MKHATRKQITGGWVEHSLSFYGVIYFGNNW